MVAVLAPKTWMENKIKISTPRVAKIRNFENTGKNFN